MSLYVVDKGAPTVMVRKKFGINIRVASFCLEHAMVFEDYELIAADQTEYHFAARDGKEYYFNTCDVRTMK